MRAINTSLKATLLATIILWSLAGVLEGASTGAIPFIFLSIIPIFIVCFFAILFTVTPFESFNKKKTGNKAIFKKYFPYYSLLTFTICSYAIITSVFDSLAIVFFTTVFFTAIQSWVWYYKTTTK